MIQEPISLPNQLDPNRLLAEEAFPHEAPALKLLETHISWVVLTGRFAYKIKKPVKLPFVDYSTLELRKHFCELELELNRELAPDIYLDVVKITGPLSSPSINGTGEILEYAVRMIEFDQADILAHRLENGLVTASEIDRLADLVADFHSRIPVSGKGDSFGTPGLIRQEAVDNFSAFLCRHDGQAGSFPGWYSSLSEKQTSQLNQLRAWTDAEFNRCAAMLDRRHSGGMIRRCHGDMHAGNIVLFQGCTEIFDRIEFNPDFQWIDCMNELAFPVMDLVHHRRPDLANRLLSDYLERTGDYEGLGVLRFYLVYRAMVRAKVDWIRQQQTHSSPDTSVGVFNTPFLELALNLSQRPSRFLYITHGLSGSGKSTAAMDCVEKTGAIRIRSDVERNRVSSSGSAGQKYSIVAKSKVYDAMLAIAESALDSGFPVVADATFLNQADRRKFRDLAHQFGIPFGIIECQASVVELERRIRERQGDASEATVAVLHNQIATQEALSSDELACRVTQYGFNSSNQK